MSISRRDFLKLSGAGAFALSSTSWMSRVMAWQADQPLDPSRHILNRVTWGATPADVSRINELGIEGYIDWQLAYEDIPDPLIDRWLAKYPFLNGSARDVYLAADADDSVYTVMPWDRIYRAVYSERQLFELMVEFWTDHFNVPAGDALGEKVVDDREVIRRHALGKFRDLLFASAQSPAMLYYLNQAESVAEHPNENYAREVMELHTLGVDGGYTERDVREVARALTGWTVREDTGGSRFTFDESIHDSGEKTILGHTLPAGRGIEDGLAVLDILASHPSTARFVSYKLVRRFVSDQPPQSLVESTAQVFFSSDGDIRQVMRHILLSPEFMAAQGQKFRRPIDFMVAMLRALRPGLDLGSHGAWLVWTLEEMGQFPYAWHPPNGYPDVAGAWMNTNGLLNRWNLALLFPFASEGWWDEIQLNLDAVIPPAATAEHLVNTSMEAILGGVDRLSLADRRLLVDFVTDGASPNMPMTAELRADKLPSLIGLMLASPAFQWR